MSKENLEKARDIVAKGWHQGWFTNDENDSYCIMGALGMACHGLVYAAAIMYHAEEACELMSHLSDVGWGGKCDSPIHRGTDRSWSCTHLPHFNDDPNTTKEMVLQLFDKA